MRVPRSRRRIAQRVGTGPGCSAANDIWQMRVDKPPGPPGDRAASTVVCWRPLPVCLNRALARGRAVREVRYLSHDRVIVEAHQARRTHARPVADATSSRHPPAEEHQPSRSRKDAGGPNTSLSMGRGCRSSPN
jgi:hypothetical protein